MNLGDVSKLVKGPVLKTGAHFALAGSSPVITVGTVVPNWSGSAFVRGVAVCSVGSIPAGSIFISLHNALLAQW